MQERRSLNGSVHLIVRGCWQAELALFEADEMEDVGSSSCFGGEGEAMTVFSLVARTMYAG